MKISEVTTPIVKKYLRIDFDDDDSLIDLLLLSAKSYIIGYTGLSESYLDNYEDITIALMILCAELYINRQMTVQGDKANKVVQSILNMHCINLL